MPQIDLLPVLAVSCRSSLLLLLFSFYSSAAAAAEGPLEPLLANRLLNTEAS